MQQNYSNARTATQRKQMHYSPNLLSTVGNAIDSCKVATIEYESFEKGVSKREVEPLAIVYSKGKRHLVAWCRLRNDFRSFRLDRLNSIRLHAENFTPKDNFRVEDFQDQPYDWRQHSEHTEED